MSETPDRQRKSKYDGDVTIPYIFDGVFEHAIPVAISDEHGLDDKMPMRFEPELDGMEITMRLTAGDDVTGDQSNERVLARRETHHVYARYPAGIAGALGLFDLASAGRPDIDDAERLDPDDAGEPNDGTVVFSDHPDGGITARYVPTITPWTEPVDATPATDAVENLTPDTRNLWAVAEADSDKDRDDLTLGDKYHLRLDLPSASADSKAGDNAYIEAYDLDPNQQATVHYGPVSVPEADTARLGLILNFEPNLDAAHQSQVIRLNRFQSDSKYGRLALYPGMSRLHSLGIGLDAVQPEVTLVPGQNHIGIIPA